MKTVYLLWGKYYDHEPYLISIHETLVGAEAAIELLEATNAHLEPGTITYSITTKEVYE